MTPINMTALAVLAVGIPVATAATYVFPPPAAPEAPCFSTGPVALRVVNGPSADYTVRIDDAAENPNLRMQLVDDASEADFVLVDDGLGACAKDGPVKSVRLQADGASDVTVALSRDTGGIRIYVKSTSFTEREAAALFAVMWKTTRHSVLAAGRG